MSYFSYSGSLSDKFLQQKVIDLLLTYYDGTATIVHPNPKLTYLTKYGIQMLEYPFNYYGISPIFNDGESMGGQFVFRSRRRWTNSPP
jgi:hypothetical protein